MYVGVVVMRDYKLKLRDLRVSHTLGNGLTEFIINRVLYPPIILL